MESERNICRRILDYQHPSLRENIRPKEILYSVVSLSRGEKEGVIQKTKHDGDIEGMDKLLDAIKIRCPEAFYEFMDAVYKSYRPIYDDIVRDIVKDDRNRPALILSKLPHVKNAENVPTKFRTTLDRVTTEQSNHDCREDKLKYLSYEICKNIMDEMDSYEFHAFEKIYTAFDLTYFQVIDLKKSVKPGQELFSILARQQNMTVCDFVSILSLSGMNRVVDIFRQSEEYTKYLPADLPQETSIGNAVNSPNTPSKTSIHNYNIHGDANIQIGSSNLFQSDGKVRETLSLPEFDTSRNSEVTEYTFPPPDVSSPKFSSLPALGQIQQPVTTSEKISSLPNCIPAPETPAQKSIEKKKDTPVEKYKGCMKDGVQATTEVEAGHTGNVSTPTKNKPGDQDKIYSATNNESVEKGIDGQADLFKAAHSFDAVSYLRNEIINTSSKPDQQRQPVDFHFPTSILETTEDQDSHGRKLDKSNKVSRMVQEPSEGTASSIGIQISNSSSLQKASGTTLTSREQDNQGLSQVSHVTSTEHSGSLGNSDLQHEVSSLDTTSQRSRPRNPNSQPMSTSLVATEDVAPPGGHDASSLPSCPHLAPPGNEDVHLTSTTSTGTADHLPHECDESVRIAEQNFTTESETTMFLREHDNQGLSQVSHVTSTEHSESQGISDLQHEVSSLDTTSQQSQTRNPNSQPMPTSLAAAEDVAPPGGQGASLLPACPHLAPPGNQDVHLTSTTSTGTADHLPIEYDESIRIAEQNFTTESAEAAEI